MVGHKAGKGHKPSSFGAGVTACQVMPEL